MGDDVVCYLVLMCSLPLFVYSMYLAGVGSGELDTGTKAFFLILFGTCVVLLVYKTLRVIGQSRLRRLGLAGEMAAAEELNRLMLDGYRVYHDFPADRFNIDHIIVGPAGVFAVETKARSKKGRGDRKAEARVTSDGRRLEFPSWTTTEPIDQAKRQAAWLSKWLSGAVDAPVKVSPMVTIPGWYIERKTRDGVPVLNPKNVKSFLDSKKESVLSETMIQRICHQLEQKCRDVDLWEWY